MTGGGGRTDTRGLEVDASGGSSSDFSSSSSSSGIWPLTGLGREGRGVACTSSTSSVGAGESSTCSTCWINVGVFERADDVAAFLLDVGFLAGAETESLSSSMAFFFAVFVPREAGFALADVEGSRLPLRPFEARIRLRLRPHHLQRRSQKRPRPHLPLLLRPSSRAPSASSRVSAATAAACPRSPLHPPLPPSSRAFPSPSSLERRSMALLRRGRLRRSFVLFANRLRLGLPRFRF